jgi:phosphoribosylformylglycinamidine cyclo-ligase
VARPSSAAKGATYAAAGVDLSAADEAVARIARIAASTATPGVVSTIGGFGGLFELDLDRYRHPVLVSSTDGIGTKMLVAKALNRYDTVGLDLVAMCVDDLVCTGAEPLFLLDYVAVGRVDPGRLAELVEGIGAGCRRVGCALIGGEIAEHPGAMGEEDLDVAGFAVGVLEKGTELGAHRVRPGDALVALLSPGLRSNGYSLVRRVLLEEAGRSLTHPAWPGADRDLGDVLLEPSVIYAPAVRSALAVAADGVHAAAHVTGGGLAGNLARVLPEGADAVVAPGTWPVPAVFDEIARVGRVEEAEMRRVFNLGVGMVLVVSESSVDGVRRALAEEGVGSATIGRITEGSGVVRWP